MNDAEITAFDNRINTFGENVRKFTERIRQVQQQMQELLNSFSDVQDVKHEQRPMQAPVNNVVVQHAKPQVQTNEQPTVQARTTIAPKSQVQAKPVQSNTVSADQEAMNIINSLDIPSLLDVGNKSNVNISQKDSNTNDDIAFTDTQPSTHQMHAPAQTEPKHETALDNAKMMDAVNDIDINQIMNTAMHQGSQKQHDL